MATSWFDEANESTAHGGPNAWTVGLFQPPELRKKVIVGRVPDHVKHRSMKLRLRGRRGCW